MRPVAELGASAVADVLVLADLALGMGQRLLRGETVAAGAARDLGPRVERDVAQLPGGFHEEVAGVDVAVVLHHHVAVACFMHGAGAGLLSGQGFRQVVEEADADVAAVGPPCVEHLDQESAVLLGGYGVGQGRAGGIELRQRNELHVIDAQPAEEPVQLLGAADVRLAEHAKDVELHALLLEQLDALDHALPGAAALLVDTVAVVHLFGAVEREAHQPLILAEEVAPVLVQQDAVGLDGVADALAVAAVLLFELHELLEERQAGQGGFAALKREDALRVGVEKVGVDEALERVEGHAASGEGLVGIGVAIEIEAVGAGEVADRRSGLDQQGADARRRAGDHALRVQREKIRARTHGSSVAGGGRGALTGS